jgi:nucleoid-associated protein YgaU
VVLADQKRAEEQRLAYLRQRAEEQRLAYLKQKAEERRLAYVNKHKARRGQTLAYVKHKVRRGQTLEKIARQYGTTVSRLKKVNGLGKIKRLKEGQVLRIPA